jgi:hypothetical protein
MSNVSEEGVAAVKNLACDKLLQVHTYAYTHIRHAKPGQAREEGERLN